MGNCQPETDASVAVCQPKPVKCGCGGEAKVQGLNGGERWFVFCRQCHTDSDLYDTEAEAITAWNTAMNGLLPEGDPKKNVGVAITNSTEPERMAKAEYSNIDGEYLCKACGRVVQIEDKYCCGCGARLEWE